ncbi:hypothetical protein FGG08_002709 [Glutinoglossum americanum]|uniref:Uncharacterized protein n=1 Tax=Glutinoglossum americanum TaxID=1670608 RepID=A0A9P8I946_9PEZI|nr:hypothetical protein FGG08_002709 [Glutinoglossum americanum]
MEEPINAIYDQTHSQLLSLLSKATSNILPTSDNIERAVSSLTPHLRKDGLGTRRTIEHLMDDIIPALNASSLSSNYYGFVTGGSTPAACIADQIVSVCDQNVQVHLPKETVATVVEDRALILLLELLELDATKWTGRTFTTGATASNVLGLACARDQVVQNALKRRGASSTDVASSGLIAACLEAGVGKIQILTAMPHSSLAKASSIVGLGRTAIEVLPLSDDQPWKLDLQKLEEKLRASGTASIVVISCGEVNTGQFSTESFEEFQHIRTLCDMYDAWIHVDGAFGLFGRILEVNGEFRDISGGCGGIELADSITGDAHKLLNVPYDCGFFFCRWPNVTQQVFRNSNAAYLTSDTTVDLNSVQSPLNIGIENSRRFRALPVYATLTAYGRAFYQTTLAQQIQFARAAASYILSHPDFELLPQYPKLDEDKIRHTYIIVLFRAKDNALNRKLVRMINATGKIYVSGTTWAGNPASRIAVSNWRVDKKRDLSIVSGVLEEVIEQWRDA